MSLLKITSISDFNLEIEIAKKAEKALEPVVKTLEYLQNTDNKKPFENLPNREVYGVLPLHFLVIKSQQADLKFFFKELINFRNKWEDYIFEIVFVGRNWLKLDIDLIPKTDGETNFIFRDKKLWKVFKNENNQQNYLKNLNLRDKTWVWKIEA